MTQWKDKEIPEKKEPYKQKLPFKQIYNEYGYNGADAYYSLNEERRDFRKNIQEEIVVEGINTQNVLGRHISEETDRNIENTDERAEEIKEQVASKAEYVIDTLSPKIDAVDSKVTSNTTVLNSIWDKVKNITHWI